MLVFRHDGGVFSARKNRRNFGRKGVSPLVASVLLIAFTMAIAAMLVAWITSFTQQTRAQSAVFEEQIRCGYASISIIDTDFTQYDASYPKAGNNYSVLSLRIQNDGRLSNIIINSYQVKYMGVPTPVTWRITPGIEISRSAENNTITALFPLTNSGNATLPDANRPERIRINTVCADVFRELTGPFGGAIGRVADLDDRTLTITATPDANVSNYIVAGLPIGP